MDTQRIITLVLGRYRWAANLVLLLVGAYFLAKTINVFVYRALRELPSLENANVRRAPASALQAVVFSPQASVQQVLTRNMLGARREIPENTDAPKKVDPNERRPCSIGNNIVGIVAANSMEWSFVVYRDPKTQETGIFSPREGRDKMPGEIQLLEVWPAEAKFRKDDHIEVCVLGDDGKAIPAAEVAAAPTPGEDGGGDGISKVNENEYAIEQKKIQWVQEHLNEVATDARIVPAFKDGKSDGFKLFSIRPGSVYQQIGLQNGDVIQKINGFEMNSPDKALEVYGKLRDAKSISVQLERRGTPKTVTYQIR